MNIDRQQVLSANNYAGMLGAFGSSLNEADRKVYLAAWNRPGGLTGGLNYYRAAQLRSPAGAQPRRPSYSMTADGEQSQDSYRWAKTVESM